MTRTRIEARTLQPGDKLTTGGVVLEVEPGPGRTVRIWTDDLEGPSIEHMDAGVWIWSRDEIDHAAELRAADRRARESDYPVDDYARLASDDV